MRLTFAAVATVAVVGAVVAGFFYAGSPASERARTLDAQRLNDLQAIAGGVDGYYEKHGSNPENLEVLRGTDPNEQYFVNSITDPETKQPYGYARQDGAAYQLCATFAMPSQPNDDMYGGYNTYAPNWTHAAGPHCFSVDSAKRAVDNDAVLREKPIPTVTPEPNPPAQAPGIERP